MTLTPWEILLVPLGLVFLAGVFVTLSRYIAYKERVALARLGFSLEDLSREAAQMRRGNRGVLWGGVITATSGLALLLGLSTLGIGVWLLGGLIPLCVGLGMVVIYLMTRGPAEQSDAAGEEEAHDEEALAPGMDGASDHSKRGRKDPARTRVESTGEHLRN